MPALIALPLAVDEPPEPAREPAAGRASGQVVSLERLLGGRQVWRGRPAEQPSRADGLATGVAGLDAVLPGGGWPCAALTELLIPADGTGELELLWPALAQSSAGDGCVVLVAPPYAPYAPAWRAAGVRLPNLHVVAADARGALWAAEQCLRSGACSAVLCWPQQVDDRALRRLQVAAEAGHCPGFAIRPLQAGRNPSPAPLRVAIECSPVRQLRVLKCRGANPPARPIAFPRPAWR